MNTFTAQDMKDYGGRLAKTLDHADSWLDAAGYIALGGEIATENKIK